MRMLKALSSRWWASAAALLAVTAPNSQAPPYAIDWYAIGGGAGSSTGGIYQLSATIGESDAHAASMGGGYSLVGGFVSIVSVIQTTGLPNLAIAHAGDVVVISWPNTGPCRLQQTCDLPGGNWTTSGYSITTVDGTNSITLNSPAGTLFFRLSNP